MKIPVAIAVHIPARAACRYPLGVFLCALLIGCLQVSWVRAQTAAPVALEMLYDSGKAVPMAPYLNYLVAGVDQSGVMADLRFPLRSRLRPGVLDAPGRRVFDSQWLVQPMFLIGSDQGSMGWLKLNHERLQAMHAWGVVVDAPNETAFKILQRAADGISLAPAQGPWLDAQLLQAGVSVYPVLIQNDGTARQILVSDDLRAQGQP